MDEHEEDKFEEKEFDEGGFDPTKEAFFSDLIGMEEEIASEAYELVEHAINLIETKYYDDAIEVLRQAIGFYSQINREEEIKAINKKISEVYLLKEQAFRKEVIETDQDIEKTIQLNVPDEPLASYLKVELAQEEFKVDLLVKAVELMNEGNRLREDNNFEEALDRYDAAVEIFEDMDKQDEVDRVFKLIEECYIKKAEYLRSVKTDLPEPQLESETKDTIGEDQLKDDKLEEYISSKKKVEEISTQGYDLLGQAAELSKYKQYKEALQLYGEGSKLFQELGWDYEVEKIEETISQLKAEQLIYLKELEKGEVEEKEEIGTQMQQVDSLEQQVMERDDHERIEKLERLRGIELQRMETEFFKAQIDNMATEASRIAREYELSMQKAIKKGELIEECIYPQVIELYQRIKELLIDKGWRSEAAIYGDTIDIYIQKFDQDKKIRQIEAEKVTRQRETEDLLKVPEREEIPVLKEDQLQVSDDQYKKELENQKIRTELEEIANKADRMAREYEVALRKGKFESICPYPEIINIFKTARQQSLEKGWETDAAIYLSQIQAYTEKLEKDKKLRQIEAEKVTKQRETEDSLKVPVRGEISALKEDQLQVSDDRYKRELENQKIRTELEEMANKADRMAREYEVALRKGKFESNCPYPEIINIFKTARQQSLEKGWETEAAIYLSQIQAYTEKLEKDKKLREIEAQKVQKQKDIEEMKKVGEKVAVDKGRLVAIEKKKEKEDFESFVTDMVNKAEKLVREHEIAMRKAMKSGQILESTPYREVIETYHQIREKVYARGWKEQSQIYANQIKIYQDKLERHVILLEVEAQKIQREKDLEEMHRVKEEFKPARPDKIKKIDDSVKEEDRLLDEAMNLIDQAEKLVKNYEVSIKSDVLLYESPYEEAISNYNKAKKLFQEIGWNDEAARLINTIKFYNEKKEKDEKLREIERNKLEKPEAELLAAKTGTEKELFDKEKKILEIEKKKKDEDNIAEAIFNEIHNAERLAQEYEVKRREKDFDHEPPYEDILKIYREARKKFEEIGWMEESMKILNTIQFYKDKLEKDKRLRSLEFEKVRKQEEELLIQQELQAQAKAEQEKIIKKRQESLLLRREQVTKFESTKDQAFQLMDHAKNELKQKNFEKAIELYKKSEEIFSQITWQEGINMVKDSISLIRRKQKTSGLEQQAIEEKRVEKLKIEGKLKEKFDKAEEIQKRQQEEKRELFLKMQGEKQWEREISEEAYDLLKKGTSLVESKKFDEAYAKFIEARNLFNKISWKREVSRINNDLLFKLKRERKAYEVLEDIKKKRVEEVKEMEVLKEEAKKERREFARQQKEDKRKLEKEKFERKIFREVDRAEKLIENYKFNEGVKILKRERSKLQKSGKEAEINRIDDMIKKVREETHVPIITLEPIDSLGNKSKVEATYKALDRAQDSIINNRFMKAISELKESRFHLKKLNVNEKTIGEIDGKILELQEKLGKKPEITEKEQETDTEMLKARVAARREERRKKVLDLLKKK